MSFITKIQLGNLGYLDIDENVSVPLNYSVAEIQDISKRQGGYSKTIKLPGTKNNNILLGQLFNVNIYDASFDQNLKSECTILQNGVPVFNGYLQLLNVVKNSPTSLNPDQIKSYEVAVKDNTGDFYTSLQEKRLQDIDLSFYDHIYNLSAITATSAHTSDDIYTYFLPNRQSGAYILTDFAPAVYAKAYWDRIFFQAGYSYTWTGMTSTGFDKLIIPYNGEIPSADVTDLVFRAGYSASTTPQLVGQFSYLLMNWNDDSSQPNNDDNGLFDLVTGQYTVPRYIENNFEIKYSYRISASASTSMYLANNTTIDYGFHNRAYSNTSILLPSADSSFYYRVNAGDTITGSTLQTLQTGVTGYTITVNQNAGDSFENKIETTINLIDQFGNSPVWKYTSDNSNVPPLLWPRFYLELGVDNDDNNNYILTSPSTQLKQDGIIRLNSFIPTQIKQKDFIASIIKMFNLYITQNPEDETNLIIQTRDEFYDSGIILDWTKKLDLNTEQKLQFLPDVTNKRLLFSYKEDKDIYNTTYLQATGEIFGQQLYTFENEFVQDIKKVEPIFSPTPLVTNVFNNVVPTIDITAPKNNIRILYYDGWINGDWEYLTSSAITITNTIVGDIQIPFSAYTYFNTYPYAGHFDNPYTPSIDIDYGTNDYEMYNDWSYITNNNLYNKYYKRQVSQIETGKLLTAKFNLNEYDLTNLDFRNKIWIHDSYWFVNKIQDYNANVDGSLTTVELINVDEGITFTPQQLEVENVGGKYSYLNNQISLDNIVLDNTIGIGVSGTDILGGQGNVITDSSVRMRIAGNGNNTATINGEIVGDLNSISGSDLFVHGYGNTIAGPANNVSIQGNLNSLSGSSNNINIVGSGNTLGSYDTNIGIYNSNDNLIQDFVSGVTLINSFNITAATGVENITIINSNNLSITGSNQTYIDNTISGGGGTIFELGSSGNFSIRAINDTFVDATGNYAYAEGQNTIGSGDSSHAEGIGSTASGTASHAQGFQTLASNSYSHAEGVNTIASGIASHTEGNNTVANAQSCHAEGNSTTATTQSSHAEGINTLASGTGSHAEGNFTIASGDYSHAQGDATTASGISSHAEGNTTLASNFATHAEGFNTIASGSTSHAEGSQTIAGGIGSHAEGEVTRASGNFSHAEGSNTIASGFYSHTEGDTTRGSGLAAHAEGKDTLASGDYSHAEGIDTLASGDYSHAEGNASSATTESSHAGGVGAITSSYGEWTRSSSQTFGQYGIVSYLYKTVDATPTEMFLDNSLSERFKIPNNTAYFVEISLVLRNTSSGDAYQYKGEALIKNIGGTTTMVDSTINPSLTGDASLSATAVALSADNTNDALVITVTGIAATTIDWFASAKYTKVI